jgi:hypothetical protein
VAHEAMFIVVAVKIISEIIKWLNYVKVLNQRFNLSKTPFLVRLLLTEP